MPTESAAQRLERLNNELKALLIAVEKKDAEVERAHAEVHMDARLERVRAAVGRKVRYMAAGNKLALKKGKLISAARKNGVVDFGPKLGRYTLPLTILEPT